MLTLPASSTDPARRFVSTVFSSGIALITMRWIFGAPRAWPGNATPSMAAPGSRLPGAAIEGVAFPGHALGAPKIQRIVIRAMPDENTVLTNLLAGSVELAGNVSIRYE